MARGAAASDGGSETRAYNHHITGSQHCLVTASPQVEVFLDEVAKWLLTELDKSEGWPEMNKAKEIQFLEAKLKEHLDRVVIPTDKMNSLGWG